MKLLVRSRWDIRFGAADRPYAPRDTAEAATPLPRRLWLFWEQGWDHAPAMVQASARSWQANNPGWSVERLDGASAERLTGMVSYMNAKGATLQAVSNMVRLTLLARHGGVWADSTTLCSAPLDDWLPPLMRAGFFAFARPGRDRLLSTWFLAATPGNPLVGAWLARCHRYWRLRSRAHIYFWCHHLFADAVRSDPQAAAVWGATPRVPARPSIELQKHWQAGSFDSTAASLHDQGTPVHKFDWRLTGDPADFQRLDRVSARRP